MDMKNWIHAMRLRTLPLAVSCIIMGSSCAFLLGGFSWNIFAWALITTVLLQVLSNLSNDYGDGVKGTDKDRIGPVRMVQSGKIGLDSMKKGMMVTGVLAFCCGIILLFMSALSLTQLISFILLGLACIAAAVFYTVGKKPYGYRALGDIMVLLFFGMVGVIGVSYLYIHALNLSLLLPALTIGCLSAAVLHLNNMRDTENDKLAGKITLANMFGLEKAKIYFHLIVIVGLFSLVLFTYLRNHTNWDDFLYVLIFPIFIMEMKNVQQTTEYAMFDKYLKPMALGTFVLSIFFALSIYL